MSPVHRPEDVGTLAKPIPVPITEDPETFEHLTLTHYFHANGRDAPETFLADGRNLHRIRVLIRPRTSQLVYFDVTLRKHKSAISPELRIQRSMLDALRTRVRGLPERGCVLCRQILESQSEGRLSKWRDLDILAQIRHLSAEGIASFRIACSLCRRVLLADRDFEADDLSACRPCQVLQRMTHEMRLVRHPKTGKIDPIALITAINSSIELRVK